jgi:seryl-tRNA synthetase
MHDIRFIREFPDKFDQSLLARGLEPQSQNILSIDADSRKLQLELQDLNTKRNEIAKSIGQAKSKGESADDLLSEGESLKQKIQIVEEELSRLQVELDAILVMQPNTIDSDVPPGRDDSENVEIRKVGHPKDLGFTPKEHDELGEALGMMDFEAAAKISGARFVVLKGALARMERALTEFMLDIHTKEFGYTEVWGPALVREQAMFGTGQFPKLEADSFKTTNGYFLIPTNEVTMTNMVADSIIPEEKLPMRFTGYSLCFRSEAGSAGKDTKGMLRQHQFSKVELVSITTEEESQLEHDRMLSAAEEVLKRLGLSYRVVILCSGDIGFAARKTYDLEVWLPGQGKYREISSCSNCGDFQARRLKARYKSIKDKKNYLVHTLNGSGLAVGRCMIAVMENYQNADGSINVPEALQPYMRGLTLIERE